MLQNRQLLIVLAPKDRALRTNESKQTDDHGRNASEVTGSVSTAEFLSQRAWVDRRRKIGRVDLAHVWGIENVCPGLFSDRGIAVEIARVTLEVLACAKLRRIDEVGDDHARAVGCGQANQRGMAGMQSAHRGHERDWAGNRSAQFGGRAGDDHASGPSPGATAAAAVGGTSGSNAVERRA